MQATQPQDLKHQTDLDFRGAYQHLSDLISQLHREIKDEKNEDRTYWLKQSLKQMKTAESFLVKSASSLYSASCQSSRKEVR